MSIVGAALLAVGTLAAPAVAQQGSGGAPPPSTLPERAGEIFELVDLGGLRAIYDRGPGDEVVDGISADYGATWDEWVTTWANHNPDVDLDAALAELGGLVIPEDAMARAATIFETSTAQEMEALFARGPGDPDYDLIAEEYGEDLDEWLRLWDIHNPDLAAARAAAAAGDDDGAQAILLVGIAALAVVAGGVVALRRRVAPDDDAPSEEAPPGFRFDR